MKHFCFVLGTRPEIIKLAPVILELRRRPQTAVTVVQTGQHKELAEPLFKQFSISPDFDLELMKPGQSLNELCGRALLKLEATLKEKYDGLIVQGDTATCMAGSIFGFLRKIPVYHVEAGLRTRDLQNPWPEEYHRKVTAVGTKLHFCPTEDSKRNLISEGFIAENIHVVGNTVIDALLLTLEKMETSTQLRQSLEVKFPYLQSSKKTFWPLFIGENPSAPPLKIFLARSASLQRRRTLKWCFHSIRIQMCSLPPTASLENLKYS